jgi:hypothetical protein
MHPYSGAASMHRHSGVARISVLAFAFAVVVACSLFVIPQRSGGICFFPCRCLFFAVVCFPPSS